MPATRRVVLDLPAEQADRIEAEVASGRYASSSDFVSALLAEEDALPPGHEDVQWGAILTEIAAEESRIDAGEAQTYALEEVFSEVRARLSAPEASSRKRA